MHHQDSHRANAFWWLIFWTNLCPKVQFSSFSGFWAMMLHCENHHVGILAGLARHDCWWPALWALRLESACHILAPEATLALLQLSKTKMKSPFHFQSALSLSLFVLVVVAFEWFRSPFCACHLVSAVSASRTFSIRCIHLCVHVSKTWKAW